LVKGKREKVKGERGKGKGERGNIKPFPLSPPAVPDFLKK
jgi:hypothetical protein